MAEVDELRDLARAFWAKEPVRCPKHNGATMHGTFVQTTYRDHIHLECSAGGESVDIPQRPKQVEFNVPQVEGLIESLGRGDSVKCFRCQANLHLDIDERPGEAPVAYRFTCVRCLSWGEWRREPQNQQIAS